MLRDVFYFNKKPNVHPRERHADSVDHARSLSRTDHFWIINEFCDYRNFDWEWDFEFLHDEDVWAEDHNNVWPSFHQKDSGTRLCSSEFSDVIIYRADVDPLARRNEENEHWVILEPIDQSKFDFSWHPDPTDPPYIYTWGNRWNPVEIQPVLEYRVDGATERKYMPAPINTLPITERWVIHQEVENFDFSWQPDPSSPPYIYVWGNKWVSAESYPTLEYHCPNATDHKYMSDPVDIVPKIEMAKWKDIQSIENFDFSWQPDPSSPPYIYVWGNKWVPGELYPTLEYHCTDATARKYMSELVNVLPEMSRWVKLIPFDEAKFDFTWRPDPTSPPYIYVWGNQHNRAEIEHTLEYHCPGATEYKYMTYVLHTLKDDKAWEVLMPIASFDFTWRPDPTSPPYIYVWGNQWNDSVKEPTVLYREEGATEYKYMDSIAICGNTTENWETLIPVTDFDYSWRPDPDSPPYIYVFGNKWNDATVEPTVLYKVEGAAEFKYMLKHVAIPASTFDNWTTAGKADTFDFSWRPNPHSPPQIYQWRDNGPRYTVPGATDIIYMDNMAEAHVKIGSVATYSIKTTLEDLINEHSTEVFWALNPDLSYDKFDFSWRPDKEKERYVNVFGNEFSKDIQTYFVNAPAFILGYKEYVYVEVNAAIEADLNMFFIDRGNPESAPRFEMLKARFPKLQKTRYLNTWVDTITRCITKTETNLCWILSSELDYAGFEFDFYPSAWQSKMVHVFGTQWSHWGNTYVVNKESFVNDTRYVKIIEHLGVLNFVKNRKAHATNRLYDIVMIEHGNKNSLAADVTVNYNDSYLQTFKDMLTLLPAKKEHYVWVCSSVCDYSSFDFSYVCDPFAKEQLHVFPSDKQKFGDTFLIDVNKLRTLIEEMLDLEDYDKISFNNHQRAKRLPAPVVDVSNDTHCGSINVEFDFPYAIFETEKITVVDHEPMNLWAANTKNIIVTSTGATRIIVPKEAKEYVRGELYDYPHIKKAATLAKSAPLDIIYFSNSEVVADKNYDHLLNVTRGLSNRVIRIDGVQGRVESQHAAANASNTPWYFLVNAKLHVNNNFDWAWQPDRLQVPKHYIFLATNPLNGLEYGHQAMVANNKIITLSTVQKGLDFTMDGEHEVVELNSGVGMFNTSPWDTWRTAFREVVKLKYYSDDNESVAKERLAIWLSASTGDYADWSLKGATEAVSFYDEVGGDIAQLKNSYEWAWLKERFNKLYPNLVTAITK